MAAWWFFTRQWSATGGLRYYNFKEDRVLNFGGFFADPTSPGWRAGKGGFRRRLAPGPPGSARLIPYGAPSVSAFAFDAKLPSYSLGNLRVGLRQDGFELAGFINNLWDEDARLALDYERGRSARVGYLTNMPRTYSVSARWEF